MDDGSNRLPILAETVRQALADADDAARTAAACAIKAGVALLEAKELLKHGGWLPWLKEHCQLSRRTAQAYMQLARKHAQMDEAKAQRVAHLTLREALKAIAESKGANPLPGPDASMEELWTWSERQVHGPINRFDYDNLDCLKAKILDRANVPIWPSILLQDSTRTPSLLRLVGWDDLWTAAERLAPLAEEKPAYRPPGIDIDPTGPHFHEVFALHMTIANLTAYMLGACLVEMDYRTETFQTGDHEADEAAWRAESNAVHHVWNASLDRRLAELQAQREELGV